MTELEKVEKLREKANVTFAEAKEALDAANGDILEALILLEKQGKSTIPAGGGFFSGDGASPSQHEQPGKNARSGGKSAGENIGDLLRRFGKFCIFLFNKGNTNFLDATKGETPLFSCPVTVLAVLLIFFFWVTVPAFIISLFCGFRYKFRGAELGKDSVINVMDSAAGVVEDVKKSLAEGRNNHYNHNNNNCGGSGQSGGDNEGGNSNGQ